RASLEEVVRRHEIFRDLAVEQLVYCSMLIERHAQARPSFTARRQAGNGVGTKDLNRLMAWKAESGAPDALTRLSECRSSASPTARLRLEQILAADGWVTQECVLFSIAPFAVEAKCPSWTA